MGDALLFWSRCAYARHVELLAAPLLDPAKSIESEGDDVWKALYVSLGRLGEFESISFFAR